MRCDEVAARELNSSVFMNSANNRKRLIQQLERRKRYCMGQGHMGSTLMPLRIWVKSTNLSIRKSILEYQGGRKADHIRPMGKTDGVEKKVLSYPPLSTALDPSNWSLGHKETGKGGSPYRGLPRISTKEACPQVSVGILGKLISLKRDL